MRGARKARGASRRMRRSPWAACSAIPTKDAMRPSLMSSTHPRALAIAVSRATLRSAKITLNRVLITRAKSTRRDLQEIAGKTLQEIEGLDIPLLLNAPKCDSEEGT